MSSALIAGSEQRSRYLPSWSPGRRAVQRRRLAACAGWLSWARGGPRVEHEVAVAHRLVRDGELENAVEDQPAAARAAAVEAEDELVEGVGQGGVVRGALVGAEPPPLGQRGDPVHAGQRRGRLPAGAEVPSLAAANCQQAVNQT